MNTDTTIHNTSNHPMEQKTAAFRYYVNRLISLPLKQREKSKERNSILNMAKNNGFSAEQITKIKKQIRQKSKEHTYINKTKTWATFTYYGGFMRGITNIFKNSTVKTAYRTTNNIFNLLASEKHTSWRLSGIYRLTCNTCNQAYIGQTGRTINIRYKEHIRYIKTNNPQSAYALHILNNRHEYGPQEETMQLVKTRTKDKHTNSWEAMYIQEYHRKGMLVTEQQPGDHNVLFDIIQTITPRDNYGLLHT